MWWWFCMHAVAGPVVFHAEEHTESTEAGALQTPLGNTTVGGHGSAAASFSAVAASSWVRSLR